MRKALFAVLTLSALALPGCIFAIGGEGRDEDWDDGIVTSDCCENCQQMLHAEHRLSVLEHHAKGDCKADCPLCQKAGAKADAAKVEAETKAKADAKAAKP